MDSYEGRCGSCAAFVRVHEDPEKGRVGECALEVFVPPLSARSTCTRYRPKGAARAAPRPRAAGTPRRYSPSTTSSARSPGPHHSRELAPVVRARALPQEIDIDMDIIEFRRVLREVLSEELGVGEYEYVSFIQEIRDPLLQKAYFEIRTSLFEEED